MSLVKRKGAGQVINVPMSSMIDVVFLLLIYFIVTQKDELTEAHLAVNLPSPNAAQQTDVKPRLMEIQVMPGQIVLQGVPREFSYLKDALAKLAALDKDQTVMIKVSRMARTEELVRIVDLCQGVGLTKLNVLTLK